MDPSMTTIPEKPFVYLAGPYTKPDPVENTHYTVRIADVLLDVGVIPVVPHLTMFWHAIRPRPYEDWLRYDLEVLARCDVLLRIPGESSGADREVARAEDLGIPVLRPESNNIWVCRDAVRQLLHEQGVQTAV
jgi:hypothetical protein